MQLRDEVEAREALGEEYKRMAARYKDDLQMIADLTGKPFEPVLEASRV